MKPTTKLKQWCWEQAIRSLGNVVMPFINDGKIQNKEYCKELSKRAEELYEWVSK